MAGSTPAPHLNVSAVELDKKGTRFLHPASPSSTQLHPSPSPSSLWSPTTTRHHQLTPISTHSTLTSRLHPFPPSSAHYRPPSPTLSHLQPPPYLLPAPSTTSTHFHPVPSTTTHNSQAHAFPISTHFHHWVELGGSSRVTGTRRGSG